MKSQALKKNAKCSYKTNVVQLYFFKTSLSVYKVGSKQSKKTMNYSKLGVKDT